MTTGCPNEKVVLAVHGDLNEDDVALMLCFAADKIPNGSKSESRGEADPMNQNVLVQALRFLETSAC